MLMYWLECSVGATTPETVLTAAPAFVTSHRVPFESIAASLVGTFRAPTQVILVPPRAWE